MINYVPQIEEVIECAKFLLSNIKPSQWCEENRIMTSDVSPWPGPFSYDKSPYLKEIVDRMAVDDPARIVAVMKGAQIGFSTGVIEAAIGWIIAQNPGNILFLTGNTELAEEAMTGKIDQMIDSCGLRPFIKPNVLRKKNMRTGDTNKSKEFPGGSLVSGGAGNHKLLRQRSVRFGFIDDFDAAKSSSKESGSTTRMIEQRFAAYADKMKLFYISTPELKQTSNIEPVYLLGDQRKYFVPCPCCGEYITLEWSTHIEGKDKEKAGITWKLDENNKLIAGSVGYICQKCGDFFDDSTKYELNANGIWKPTAEPSQVGYFSYHLSSLYAPPGMYDWEHYVRQYLEANPINGRQIDALQKTFVNLCLGETYFETGEAPKANDLQRNNIRNYQIGIVPESVSIKDGNGKIVLITCACDLNGTIYDAERKFEDDARLDYEIVAWSETGASYSVVHGSIGTFIPREGQKKNKEERERWTYEFGKPNSVWTEFSKILDTPLVFDTGKKMRIVITGVDTGHYTHLAYPYIDSRIGRGVIVALKGDKENKYRKYGVDTAKFRPGKERPNLYLVDVNQLKDELANIMTLKWDDDNDDSQPYGFMNFPQPADGKYLFKNYFSHFESEHRVIENKDGEGVGSMWKKKTTVSQNHFWDVRIYNMVVKEIVVSIFCKDLKIKGVWTDYVGIIMNSK